jgi:FkbM family methyltransferase
MLYGILGALAGLAGLAAALLVLMRAREAGIAMQRALGQINDEASQLRTSFQAAQLNQAQWSEQFHKEMTGVRDQLLYETRTRIAELHRTVEETTQIVVRKHLEVLSLDTRLAQDGGEEKLLRYAEAIAILRPLVPYPRWTTDADLNNPDFSYQLRRWLWQYFHDRKGEAPITVAWHGGTRLRLQLGNDESAQIYVAGCVEPNEFAFLDRLLQPGMTFVDAGANDGIYSVFAAKRVGPEGTVWAFEPSRREQERLRCNLELNGLNARVFPMALADVHGQAEFTVSDAEHQGQSTLGAFAHDGVQVQGKEMVEVRRLDDLVREHALTRIDVLKLDVEGAELRVLRGAAGAIERYRPYILIEVSEESLRHQGTSAEELLDFLRNQQYRIHGFDRVTGLPFPAAPGVYSDNMIGVPEERPLPEAAVSLWPVLA